MDRKLDLINSMLVCNGSPIIDIESGWYPLLIDLFKKWQKVSMRFEISAIRKRDGKLDINFKLSGDDHNYYIIPLIEHYIELSQSTCEICGQKGEVRASGLILCEDHAKTDGMKS